MRIKNKFQEAVPNIKPVLRNKFNWRKTGEINTTMLDEGLHRNPRFELAPIEDRHLAPKTMTSLKSRNTFNDLNFQSEMPAQAHGQFAKMPSLQNMIIQKNDLLLTPHSKPNF